MNPAMMQQMMQMMQGGMGGAGAAGAAGQGGEQSVPLLAYSNQLIDREFPGFNPPTGPRAGGDSASGGAQTDEFGRALKRSRQD
jgi:hypothetical protein